MRRIIIFISLITLGFPFHIQANAQDDLMTLVKEIQKNIQRNYDFIESVQYSGVSKFQVYIGWNALGLNMIPVAEEYHFNGIWMKPDSVRLEIVAFRKATPDTGRESQNMEFGMPSPNPFQFSYDASALGTDEENKNLRPIINISRYDIKNLKSLANKIYKAKDPVSQFLKESLSDTGRIVLEGYKKSIIKEDSLRKILPREINRILKGESIYDPARFAKVKLSDKVLALAAKNPEGNDLYRLNRLLLEETYKKEIRNRQDRRDKRREMVTWPLFPFAAGADSIYNYELVSEIGFGYRKIQEIFVSPKFPDVPGVIGYFQIDPDEKVVVGSDVTFNDAAEFLQQEMEMDDAPRLVKAFTKIDEEHKVKTKMGLVYSSYWMPETIKEEFFVKIWGIKAKIMREINFTSYLVNERLPDTTIFADKKFKMKRDPVLEKEVFKDWQAVNKLPKGMEEKMIKEIEKKFASLELSDELLSSEFLFGGIVNNSTANRGKKYFGVAQQYGNNVIYNRVEGLQLNHALSYANPILLNNSIAVKGGYGFKDERWKGEAAVIQYFGRERKLLAEANIFNTITFNESSKRFPTSRNTFAALFFNADYRDYYYKTGGSIGIGYKATENLAVKFTAINQTEESAYNNTRFSITRYKTPFRLNPEILEGELRSIKTSILYRTGGINADITMEHSDRDNLHSDFSFTSLEANFNWTHRFDKLHSFYFGVSGLTSDGTLPPQRWFDFGGKSWLNYNGNLRGTGYKAFTGDRAAYGTFEFMRYGKDMFDFTPDDSKQDSYLRVLKFTFWAGAGWSELSGKSLAAAEGLLTPGQTTDDIYHEFGIGIGDRFNAFRVDFVRNSISKNYIIFSFNFFR